MAGFVGMDVEGVQKLGSDLGNRAQEIEQILNVLTSALGNTQWVGTDATNFRNEWQSQHVPALRNVAHALQNAQQSCVRNAQQQASASGN